MGLPSALAKVRGKLRGLIAYRMRPRAGIVAIVAATGQQACFPGEACAPYESRAAVTVSNCHSDFSRKREMSGRVTPAMEAGISDHVWTIEELVKLLDRAAKLAA